jgi:hypothetical protein
LIETIELELMQMRLVAQSQKVAQILDQAYVTMLCKTRGVKLPEDFALREPSMRVRQDQLNLLWLTKNSISNQLEQLVETATIDVDSAEE